MLRLVATLASAALAAGTLSAARAAEGTREPPEQWYTGSLLSPSGAMPKAGLLGIEPYLVGLDQTGEFDADGHARDAADPRRAATNVTLVKYGITDRLSLQLLPSFLYVWDRDGTSSGLKAADSSVEFQYRLVDPAPVRGIPAVSLFLGMNVPLGDYDRLARSEDGVGTGVWAARFGVFAQQGFRLPGGTAMRIRIWSVARAPVASVGLHGASVYDTKAGFAGQAAVGVFGNAGASVEWGATRHWVLALDVVRDWADGTRLRGHDADGSLVARHLPASGDWTLAPAVEYNFTGAVGLIAGVAFTAAGHNTTQSVQPQVALNLVF